jgi:hypothetical protein
VFQVLVDRYHCAGADAVIAFLYVSSSSGMERHERPAAQAEPAVLNRIHSFRTPEAFFLYYRKLGVVVEQLLTGTRENHGNGFEGKLKLRDRRRKMQIQPR